MTCARARDRSVADLAPFAFRSDAYLEVGGLDEGLAEPGECAIGQDYELSTRLWLSGWQVGRLAGRGGGRLFGLGGTGGTHANHFSHLQCWVKQGVLLGPASERTSLLVMRRVWNAVREANEAHLQLMVDGTPPWARCCVEWPGAPRQHCGNITDNTYPFDYP